MYLYAEDAIIFAFVKEFNYYGYKMNALMKINIDHLFVALTLTQHRNNAPIE